MLINFDQQQIALFYVVIIYPSICNVLFADIYYKCMFH